VLCKAIGDIVGDEGLGVLRDLDWGRTDVLSS